MLSKLLNIANESGTSYPLAKNIAAAAEQANELGILEWANATAQLRLAEWALIAAAFLLIAWAAIILLGVWKRWPKKLHLLTTTIATLGIAAGLWPYQKWTPPVHDAVIIHPSTAPDGKPLTSTNLLISPFDTAEIVTTLPIATHVLIDPEKAADHYRHITHPDTGLSGWIPAKNVRQVGE
jgi:hypothetical protein